MHVGPNITHGLRNQIEASHRVFCKRHRSLKPLAPEHITNMLWHVEPCAWSQKSNLFIMGPRETTYMDPEWGKIPFGYFGCRVGATAARAQSPTAQRWTHHQMRNRLFQHLISASLTCHWSDAPSNCWTLTMDLHARAVEYKYHSLHTTPSVNTGIPDAITACFRNVSKRNPNYVKTI